MMNVFVNPPIRNWEKLTKRNNLAFEDLQDVVSGVFEDVRKNGDAALFRLTRKFDQADLNALRVDSKTMKNAVRMVDMTLRSAIEMAAENIETFHRSQKEKVKKIETTRGVVCWRESRPIEAIGLYIPGGTAPLFSTVLMLGIPAKIAGCREVVLCTPPDSDGKINPVILFAARLVGIQSVYALGGIQAIAAMAVGTETVPRVSKIFGPGNQYVTAAKQFAQYGGVAIDMPAGPSEVLILADSSADPEFVAADLLSQAEHGADSQVILVSTDAKLVERVQAELKSQLKNLPRKNIAAEALKNSRAILLENEDQCIRFSNLYAPEHLILVTRSAKRLAKKVVNAGSIFIGNYSCESAGDYASGTNHTLPTSGYARNYSGVSLDSFIRKITFQKISKAGIKRIGPSIEKMAEAEALFAHKNAVTVRLKKTKK